MIAINFCLLVDFIRPTGSMVTMVTRYTGGLSQLLLVEMSWEKILRKNLWFRTTFVFYSILKLGPGHRVTWYTGGISRLPVVKMSWEKNLRKKPGIPNKSCFLFNFGISNID